MAFAPRRPAGRLFAYWRSEQRTLRQGFAALLLGTAAAFIAGATLSSITDTLKRLPGLIILIPAVIGMRGTIFGALGARLGTSTHAGLFEVSRRRTGVLYQNVFVAIVLTLASSLYLAVLAKGSAAAFGLESIRFLDLVTIAVVGGVVDSTIILALTLGLSVLSFRRGYDLDTVSTPVVTSAADAITVPTLFAATFLIEIRWLSNSLAIVSIVVGLYAIFRGIATDLPLARRIFLEMIAVVLLTPLLDILAGTFLEARFERFEFYPGLLALVPPFVAIAGALGGILSSRLSSKLHLGVISARGRPEAPALLDASLVVGFGVVAFTLAGVMGLVFSEVVGQPHPGAGPMVAGTLVAGLAATAIVLVVSYYVAILTARFGLDPDNQSVPVITSVMDLSGVLCLLVVLALFGVGAHV